MVKRELSDDEVEERSSSEEVIAKKSKASKRRVDSEGEGSESIEEAGVQIKKNEQGEEYFQLSDKRRLTINSYRGQVYVSIREYYEDKADGSMKPGKSGINLSLDQWELLKDTTATIDQMVARAKGANGKDEKAKKKRK